MHSNSGSSVSLLVDNNATVKAGGYCASGKASVPSHITPPARSYCEPLLDPFRNLPAPMAGSHREQPGGHAETDRHADPGTYCGGLTIKGTATLNPGVYIVSDLTVASQATIKGGWRDVLSHRRERRLHPSGGRYDRPERRNVGPVWEDILFFQDRFANPGFVNLFAGNSDTKVFGSIYTPSQKVRVAGTSGVNQTSPSCPSLRTKSRSQAISGHSRRSFSTAAVPSPKTESGARLVE